VHDCANGGEEPRAALPSLPAPRRYAWVCALDWLEHGCAGGEAALRDSVFLTDAPSPGAKGGWLPKVGSRAGPQRGPLSFADSAELVFSSATALVKRWVYL
jgi:hypothetical protein